MELVILFWVFLSYLLWNVIQPKKWLDFVKVLGGPITCLAVLSKGFSTFPEDPSE